VTRGAFDISLRKASVGSGHRNYFAIIANAVKYMSEYIWADFVHCL